MNQRLENYLLERKKELRAIDTKDSLELICTIHGSLMEIDLIFANFGYSNKTTRIHQTHAEERDRSK